ncbi:MAG: copper ion binding protein [Methanothrix sp.]|nr:copper ion binding protein [Methanothrix sp.]
MAATKKAEIKVTGMACAACSAAVERSLSNLNGVASAAVNLSAETASIEYDPERLQLVDLEKAIRDAGYDVVDDEVVLKIGGMSCAMCVAALEAALLKLERPM